MTTTAPIPPITGIATIAVPIERAFEVFAGSINSWWPHVYHIGQAEVAEVILEPREGGRWYERGVDDTECDWGRVLVWDPPSRLVFTWQINGSWQFDPDPAHASEIEVLFTSGGPHETTVEVEHRHFDRLVGGQTINDAIRGGGGWDLLLAGLAKAVEARQ
jgi:uncharacterized protein YndB with AHSA1/START domain